jgi:DNA-binding NtrC family response regulator
MARILLIDDEEGIQRYLTRMLNGMGHEVLVAGNGTIGSQMALDPTVELILTDLAMPGTPSGMELVQKIRADRPECPVVVVSGYPTAERLKECNELGINDFLTKPFEISFVRGVITRLLGKGGKPNPKA